MTVKEVIEITNIPKSTLYRMIYEHKGLGREFTHKPGRGYIFIGNKETLKNARNR